MELMKKQAEKGYIAASTLLFIFGAVVILAFVIETGRMLITNSQVTNGTDLAASAGVFKYGKELKKQTANEYQIAYNVSKIEVETEFGVSGLSQEEIEALVKQKTKEKMVIKIPSIKSAARSACLDKVKDIINENKLRFVSGQCTDTEVLVTAKLLFSPVMSELPQDASEMTRTAKKGIVLSMN
jgi:hypothetical protein